MLISIWKKPTNFRRINANYVATEGDSQIAILTVSDDYSDVEIMARAEAHVAESKDIIGKVSIVKKGSPSYYAEVRTIYTWRNAVTFNRWDVLAFIKQTHKAGMPTDIKTIANVVYDNLCIHELLFLNAQMRMDKPLHDDLIEEVMFILKSFVMPEFGES